MSETPERLLNLHVDRRDDGFALYIDGDLQFDTADERLYHELLALPALTLAAERLNGLALRVLICGGGDGLALRECLRFPGVATVDLVDYSPEVVDLGRTELADLNDRAFEDPRASVHIQDAWPFLETAEPYDVVICDFTVPRRPEDARVFSLEWYQRVRSALNPGGVIAVNGLSPQRTPEAFHCLNRTARAAGLHALPYRVCLPSFRDQGYGVWSFTLASDTPIHINELERLVCPVPTIQADLTKLARAARFSRSERRRIANAPIDTIADPIVVDLLLNPGAVTDQLSNVSSFDLESFLNSIPIAHPYHTRTMVEALAEQVVGSVSRLDLTKLVDALLVRADRLTSDLKRELLGLKQFLSARLLNVDAFRLWSARLFAALVILMTLANAIAPDNAFAKGSFGLGHASISRGYGGSFEGPRGYVSGGRESGSFGGGRGFSNAPTGRSGSFGGSRGFESSFGTPTATRSGGFGSAPSITSSGFRAGYGRGRAVDIYGYSYTPRTFTYFGGGYDHIHMNYVANGRPPPSTPPEEHQTLFVADDDMMVLDNGDVVVTLSDSAFLLVTNGTVSLFDKSTPEPLLAMYSDPKLFGNIADQIQGQQIQAEREVDARKDWLGWVGWTSALFPVVQGDRQELSNLQDLERKLGSAVERVGRPNPPNAPAGVASGAVEMFVGCFLLPNGNVAFCRPDGNWLYTDGASLRTDQPNDHRRPCPKPLTVAIAGILKKLDRETLADHASAEHDLSQLAADRTSLYNDLNEYNRLYYNNGSDSSYEVDYGTDEIPVSDAINRTLRDIDQNRGDTILAQNQLEKLTSDWRSIHAAAERFDQLRVTTRRLNELARR